MNRPLLSKAFAGLLGVPNPGDLAFTRCLSASEADELLSESGLAVTGWRVFGVGDAQGAAWITADRAVELREEKGPATLLLVDAKSAGAGMDGIYSAAREIDEETLFSTAIELATHSLQRELKIFAGDAIKRARRVGGRRHGLARRQEFDFYGALVEKPEMAGRLLHLLGLWPVAGNVQEAASLLGQSGLMVEKLLVPPATSQAPQVRIASLVLRGANGDQARELETLLRNAGARPRAEVLAEAAASEGLLLGRLRPAFLDNELASLEIVLWRRANGALFAWSGLRILPDGELPHYLIDRNTTGTQLEVRWRVEPEHLPKTAVTYEVRVLAGTEVLASRQVEHNGKSEQKVVFTQEDFEDLEDSGKWETTVEVAALGVSSVEPKRTEDFILAYGEAPPTERVASGEVFRCLADGLVQAEDSETLKQFVEQRQQGKQALPDKHGFLSARLTGTRRGFRVERPRLVDEVDRQWAAHSNDPVCRWSLRCRPDGVWTAQPELIPLSRNACPEPDWARLVEASRRFRDDAMKAGGTLSRFYLHGHSSAQTTADYLNAWLSAMESGDPELALANTVEVQNAAGRPIGVIVLPSHPLRVAWQAAYDTLAIHLRHEEKLPVKRVRENLAWIDGANYPFALPGLRDGETLVFGDILGLCAVAMVPDTDREPKSTIATLAACFAGESERIAPALSEGSGAALAREVRHYLDTHPEFRSVHVHALRPGDGATVVRALGHALRIPSAEDDNDSLESARLRDVAFRLTIHPTETQSAIAGRHLVRLNQRRRSGSAALPEEDAWCLGSLPREGDRTVPRLRWAKRDAAPTTPAHLSLAFDTFSTSIVAEPVPAEKHPLLAFGLIAHIRRVFSFRDGNPCWHLSIPAEHDGEKLPDRIVTDRLLKLHAATLRCAVRPSGVQGSWPVLKTELDADDLDTLRTLHRLSDWVVTVNRNAGIEFYDSPRESAGAPIFEAYVIDAVPERDDLGCLQMITSTAHFDEVRHLLDHTLTLMGLSSSARNCEFLLNQLKALSGRLAMRLAAGAKEESASRVGSELVALALARTKCVSAQESDPCWLALRRGIFIPLDDVCDLLPTVEPRDDIATDENVTIEDGRRADLLFVGAAGRGRLVFRFVEVKYRRHLAMARSAALRETIVRQTSNIRQRWMEWFFGPKLTKTERALRAARLCRVLRFYTEKARRHYLEEESYARLSEEFTRLLQSPSEYEPVTMDAPDRGFVFCPDYRNSSAEELHAGLIDDCRVWLFGPDTLPDRPPEVAYAPPPPTPVTEEPPSPPEDLPPAPSPSSDNTAMVASPDAPHVPLGKTSSGETVSWSPSIRGNPHLMIVGLPGMGKTTSLINICRRLVDGGVMPIVFSYHDDIDEKLTASFPNLIASDCHNLGFNPMRVTHASPRAHVESAGQLRDIFSAIFPELGELQLEQLRSAVKDSYKAAGWGSGETEAQPPRFRHFLEILRSQEKSDARTLGLLARLDELDDFEFFQSEQGASSLLDATQPQVLRIHSSTNEAVQRAYASFVLYRIYQDMFARGRQERITHAVIFDEAHRASRLKLIPTMAKECRKYGLCMIVASQEARDFDTGLYSAIANYLVLRVTDQDARSLARNVAASDLERRLADRLKALPKYNALLFSEKNRQPVQLHLAPELDLGQF